jgi:hypothetical protein
MIHGNLVRKLRWLCLKAHRLLYGKQHKIGNPRDKKRKKESSEFVAFLVVYFRVINAAMAAVVIVALLLLCWVKAGG